MDNNNQKLIVVCVATYKRPEMLSSCLSAICLADVPEHHTLHIVVVDNDINGSAEIVCNQFTADIALRYFLEPSRGISSARNRLLEEAVKISPDWIAFVDDDELPHRSWLTNHMNGLLEYNADVSAGPVIQVQGNKPSATYCPDNSRPLGSIPRFVAAGNVIFSSQLVKKSGMSFDRFYDFIGGEDFDFFSRSRSAGYRHIWNPDAVIFETLPPERNNIKYLFFRHMTGAINNVLRDKRNNGNFHAWIRFLPKIIGKLLTAIISLVFSLFSSRKENFNNAIKKFASCIGYSLGLVNYVIERYR